MSVFGPNQVEELILGNAVATEATISTFIASASDKEIKAVAADGGAAGLGKTFKVLQKTDGSAAKGLNFEFSDIVKASKVNSVVVKEYNAEVQKSVSIGGFDGNVVADTTYSVEIRLYNDGGSLSPENFVMISGYYVTSSSIANETAATIRDGIVKSLNYNLNKRAAGEFTVTTPDTSETDIVITGEYQEVVPGKIIGRQIEFEVTAKQFKDGDYYQNDLFLLTSTTLVENNPGTGTGKYAVNLEWFTKGFKYEVYRQTGYPADFNTPYYASKTGVYNAIHIKYFDSRISPTVEEQHKVLTILVDKGTDTLANNAGINSVLADLRVFLGTDNVPADLAVA